jgi:hypothetical protein
METAGDVGRRYDNAIGFGIGTAAGTKMPRRLPLGIDAVLDLAGGECLIEHGMT